MNCVTLIGRLTRDPDLRYTPSGAAVCSFSIAINEKRKRQDGTVDDRVDFFDCVAWNKTAELVSQYLHKGSQLGIQGKLVQDRWEKDGEKRSKVKVLAFRIEFLGKREDGGSGAPTPHEAERAEVGKPAEEPFDLPDEDVPF